MKRDVWKLGLFLLLIALSCQIEVFGCYPLLAAAFMAVYMEDFHRGKILFFVYMCMVLWLPMASLAKYGVALLVSVVAVLFTERMFQSCRRIWGAALTGGITALVGYGGTVLPIGGVRHPLIPALEGLLIFSLCFFLNRGAAYIIQLEPVKRKRPEQLREGRLLEYAQAMGVLSRSFSRMSQMRQSGSGEMEYMCRELTARVCGACSQCAECAIRSADTPMLFTRLLSSLWETGQVEEEVRRDLEEGCVCSGEVLEEAARIFEKAHLNLAWYNRLIENRELIAGQIDAMAGCLKDCIDKETQVDEQERGRILSLQFQLRERGVSPSHIHFFEQSDGTKKITMDLRAGRGRYLPMKEILPVVSGCAGVPMASVKSNYRFVGREKNSYVFVTKPLYSCTYGVASLTKEGEEISGDNFSARELTCGHYLFALSDGMGSGWQANRESETVLELLEQFAEAQFTMEVALRLMNAAMVFGGSQERYSTLDVCAVDGYTGICEFYTVGGHVSYIRHRSGVEVVAEENLPIGAAAQLDTMPWRGHLEDGDILVMITDGVLEYLKGDRPADILGEIICAIREPDPERFSKELLREVLARTEGKIYDDMTVLTIRAWET